MHEAKHIWQCSCCGHVEINNQKGKYEYLFEEIYCPCCRGSTKHYYCGDNILDYYELYDPILDKRYYNYNTK